MTLLRNCVTQRNADALKVLIDFKVDLDFVPGLVNGVWTKSAIHTETNVHRAVQTLDSGEIGMGLSSHSQYIGYSPGTYQN